MISLYATSLTYSLHVFPQGQVSSDFWTLLERQISEGRRLFESLADDTFNAILNVSTLPDIIPSTALMCSVLTPSWQVQSA